MELRDVQIQLCWVFFTTMRSYNSFFTRQNFIDRGTSCSACTLNFTQFFSFSWSQLYFVAWYLISVILIINLFIALILEVSLLPWLSPRIFLFTLNSLSTIKSFFC